MSYILIERSSEDCLTVEKWRFCVIDTRIILDDYTKVVLPSRRHKIGTEVAHYNRLSERKNTITETEVPWDDSIASEALAAYVKQVKVGRWKTDFGR